MTDDTIPVSRSGCNLKVVEGGGEDDRVLQPPHAPMMFFSFSGHDVAGEGGQWQVGKVGR